MMRPLHLQLRALRKQQRRRAEDIGAHVGVHYVSIRSWDRGARTPRVRHAIAYAHAVHHRLIVIRGGRIIGDLADLLPHMHTLRIQERLSLQGMAHRAYTAKASVYRVERHSREGSVRLSTVEWYLTTLGYAIQLMPADRLERAA